MQILNQVRLENNIRKVVGVMDWTVKKMDDGDSLGNDVLDKSEIYYIKFLGE